MSAIYPDDCDDPMPHDPEYVSLGDLAEITRLPKSYLKREARAGRIPSIKIGRAWHFNVPAVSRALEENAAKALATNGGSLAEARTDRTRRAASPTTAGEPLSSGNGESEPYK